MAHSCGICTRRDRYEIEMHIIQGTPYRDLENLFGVGRNVVMRHAASLTQSVQEKTKIRVKPRVAHELTPTEDLPHEYVNSLHEVLIGLHAETIRHARVAREHFEQQKPGSEAWKEAFEFMSLITHRAISAIQKSGIIAIDKLKKSNDPDQLNQIELRLKIEAQSD